MPEIGTVISTVISKVISKDNSLNINSFDSYSSTPNGTVISTVISTVNGTVISPSGQFLWPMYSDEDGNRFAHLEAATKAEVSVTVLVTLMCRQRRIQRTG